MERKNKFRPEKLVDLIGQDQIKNALQICLDASKVKKERLPHILFQGPPGTGKSTLGRILANELGTYCTNINGATISGPHAIIKALCQAKDSEIVFIDEIHALPSKVAEMLYMPLEDRVLLIQDQDKKNSRVITVNLQDFTLVGATTNIGSVPKPLLDRMGTRFYLDFYNNDHIQEIVKNNASVLNLNITDSAAEEIAKRCKGVPRIANNYVKWIENYAISNNISCVSDTDANRAFSLYGVNEIGLDNNDKLYLKTLKESFDPLGIKAISSISGIPEKAIEEHIEPYLLRAGLIKKTKRGRIYSQKQGDEDAIEKLFYGATN